ncbi:MAG TPA: maleylpyruvate isomerase family mycothiol-dependent enzyme [Actinomycetota bacterium]|nr:maleylpyruvate isomerase family mycothiol-dependent enzyme [Actinomycetota bacterium]
MPDLVDVYERLRGDISEHVAGLDSGALGTPVPATPDWSVRDVVAHLAADASYAIRGDLPREFFGALGEDGAVASLNDWTRRQLDERRDRSLQELLDEWASSARDLAAMMRGDEPWPDGTLMFIDRVLVTDAAAHQQDIFGALGIRRDRDGAPIKIGLSSFIAAMGFRLASAGIPPLRFDVGDKAYTAGDGEPGATVHATRFELFRALSGRRSPEQIAAYDWDGDAEPYVPYFYPYGVREEALVE